MRRLAAVLLSSSLLLMPLASSAGPFDGLPPSPAAAGRLDGLMDKLNELRRIPEQYIVTFKDGVEPQGAAEDLTRRSGGELLQVYGHALHGFTARLSASKLAALRADPRVASISEDYEVSMARIGPDAFGVPKGAAVTATSTQTTPTGLSRILAANRPNQGEGVEVAVIDTGIDVSHPDLKANVLGGYNCTTWLRSAYQDQNGHGTHVAGTIAALDNGVGVVGVAPKAKLWAVRVLDRNGGGSWSSVICGIDWVTSQASHIKVANMSLGGGGPADDCASPTVSTLHRAICNSVAKGVTYVVAAGNSNDDLQNQVPASYPETIAVTALADSNGQPCGGGAALSYGADDTFASFSNFGTRASDLARTIAAPGVSIYSTWMGSKYNTISGTSMASPHVAGAAALYLSKYPGSTPAQVKQALLLNAEKPDVNFKSECATGVSHPGTTKHPEAVLRVDGL